MNSDDEEMATILFEEEAKVDAAADVDNKHMEILAYLLAMYA
jgi:hypothetical protein